MGIPKFYRYIAQRWPAIQQEVESNDTIPEYDNLYLDMNSILHNCTRTPSVNVVLTDEMVCQKVFAYIDHLFNYVKPQSTVYLAIDGVAPRAKINQQRSRRFRAAQEFEEARDEAIENGTYIQPPPEDENTFYKSSISPGTVFMAKMSEQLKYFIHDKVSNDNSWKNINVIFSGHEVPGEGEHKIMEFIRSLKSSPNYNINTRHCIYGLDADLIMLGLVTHEPYVSILREEVLFGKESEKVVSLDGQKFYLLHISIVREYLKLEFDTLVKDMQFEYDFERVLDDFILAMMVIGNDFLPHLPGLEINKGAFDYILQGFKSIFQDLTGYMSENAVINFEKFSVWVNFLASIEEATFEKQDIDVTWFNEKLIELSQESEIKRNSIGRTVLVKDQKKMIGYLRKWVYKNAQTLLGPEIYQNPPTLNLNENNIKVNEFDSENFELLKTFSHKLHYNLVHSASTDEYFLKMFAEEKYQHETETQEEMEERVRDARQIFRNYDHSVVFEDQNTLNEKKLMIEQRFDNWKAGYYKKKMDMDYINSPHDVVKLSENFAEGLQWVMYYYYRGCASWDWYYKYHYAPRISDLASGFQNKFEFELGQPLLPFVQLMAILPPLFKINVPSAYRHLMVDENSPIIDAYPTDFEIDLNGKRQAWEAVILLDAIDINRLKKAMEPYNHLLTDEEKRRNSHGTDLIFIYDAQIDNVYQSPLKGMFKSLPNNHCIEQPYILQKLPLDKIKFGLHDGVKVGQQSFGSFPSLHYLPFSFNTEHNETRVFNMASRDLSVVLHFDQNDISTVNDETIIHSYLGKNVYTRYPNVRLSKVHSISTDDGRFFLDQHGKVSHTPHKNVANFRRDAARFENNLKSRFAFVIGKVRFLFEVLPVEGVIRTDDGSYRLSFLTPNEPEIYPFQLIVDQVGNDDVRFVEKDAVPIEDEFPIGSEHIFLGDFAYGAPSVVAGYSDDKKTLKLKVDTSNVADNSIPFVKKVAEADKRALRYYQQHQIIKMFDLSPLFFSRIIGKFLVMFKNQKINVGFNLVHMLDNMRALGYAEKGAFWTFSELIVTLFNEFKGKYPLLFNGINNYLKNLPKGKNLPMVVLDDLCEGKTKELEAELESFKPWRNEIKDNTVYVSVFSKSLSRNAMSEVEKIAIMNNNIQSKAPVYKKLASVPPSAIMDPEQAYGLLRTQRFDLGDRVEYIQHHGKIPYGSRGTVIGYLHEGTVTNIQVLFDQEIVSGNTLGDRIQTTRAILLGKSTLLNITSRMLIFKDPTAKVADKQAAEINKVKEEEKKKKARELLSVIKGKDSQKPPARLIDKTGGLKKKQENQKAQESLEKKKAKDSKPKNDKPFVKTQKKKKDVSKSDGQKKDEKTHQKPKTQAKKKKPASKPVEKVAESKDSEDKQ
ncbi:unnamed protein product [Hanseniaspora opuntiae]